MLEINDLYASIEGKHVLKGLSLKVSPGEVHAIMGPNGAGKSTAAKVLAGHPHYEVSRGKVLFFGKDLLEMEIEERSYLGLFLGFQYPVEISGVTNFTFLHAAHSAHQKHHGEKVLDEKAFRSLAYLKMEEMRIPKSFIERDVNGGFSGGEKKRNEVLQMALLKPKLAVLDETDSGLDIDAMRIVADGVNKQRTKENSLVLITHYQRLLEYISPDFVHVMVDGKIVQSGGADLALKLEEKGYDWVV